MKNIPEAIAFIVFVLTLGYMEINGVPAGKLWGVVVFWILAFGFVRHGVDVADAVRAKQNPTTELAKVVGKARLMGKEAGVKEAAEFAGTFDAQIDHEYMFEDVVLCKFNIIKKRKMRKKARNG